MRRFTTMAVLVPVGVAGVLAMGTGTGLAGRRDRGGYEVEREQRIEAFRRDRDSREDRHDDDDDRGRDRGGHHNDDDDDRGRGHYRPAPLPAFREPAPVRVWVEPVYRTTCDQVWVEPVYRDVTQRVWREPVVETVCEQVWVPARYEWRQVVRYDECGRRLCMREKVCVEPAHYETVRREIVVCEGRWDEVCRQELVCEGHWKTIERQELVSAGHWEHREPPVGTRTEVSFRIGW